MEIDNLDPILKELIKRELTKILIDIDSYVNTPSFFPETEEASKIIKKIKVHATTKQCVAYMKLFNTPVFYDTFKNHLKDGIKNWKNYKPQESIFHYKVLSNMCMSYNPSLACYYYQVFSEMVINIGESASKIEEDLTFLLNTAYTDYNIDLEFSIFDLLLDVFYTAFKNNNYIINQINEYVAILNKVKINFINLHINKMIKKYEINNSYKKMTINDFKKELNNISLILISFNDTNFLKITEEEEKEINLNGFFSYLPDNKKEKIFNKIIMTFPEKEKSFFAEYYFQNEALKQMLK